VACSERESCTVEEASPGRGYQSRVSEKGKAGEGSPRSDDGDPNILTAIRQGGEMQLCTSLGGRVYL
jgi:hypothetical protein